ncbi:MAG: hypothetical protein Q9216_005379, partial [Gyalolechia sp. 2 TL-2023]
MTEIVTPEAAKSVHGTSAPAERIEKVVSSAELPEQSLSSIQEQTKAHEPSGTRSSTHAPEDNIVLESRSSPQDVHHSTKQRWYHSMYAEDDSEDFAESYLAPQSPESGNEDDLKDATATNPWTIAKVNAPIGHHQAADRISKDLSRNDQLLTPGKENGDLSRDLSSPLRRCVPNLPTPAKSQNVASNEQSSPDMFPYPRRAWGKAHRETNSILHRSSSSSSEEPEPPSSGALDTWVQRTPAQPRAADQDLPLAEQSSIPTTTRSSDFVSATTLAQGTPLSAIPDISSKPRRKPQRANDNVKKPFTPPVRDLSRVLFDGLEPSSSAAAARSQQPKQQRRGKDALPATDLPSDPIAASSPSSRSIPPASIHPGLALTMDYEKRKADAMSARRAFLRQQQQQSQPRSLPLGKTLLPTSSPAANPQNSSSSPHHNRYRTAREALRPPSTTTTSTGETSHDPHLSARGGIPVLNPNDPRAYLMRLGDQQQQQQRTKRVQTSLLPLETLSAAGAAAEGGGVRGLVQIVHTEGLVGRIEQV